MRHSKKVKVGQQFNTAHIVNRDPQLFSWKFTLERHFLMLRLGHDDVLQAGIPLDIFLLLNGFPTSIAGIIVPTLNLIILRWSPGARGRKVLSVVIILPIVISFTILLSIFFSILVLRGIIAPIFILRFVHIVFILVLLVFLIFLFFSTKPSNIIKPDNTFLNISCALLHHSKHQVILAGAETKHAFTGVHSGDETVVARIKGLECRLELGLILQLLFQVDPEDHLPTGVEDHLALVELGYCAQQVEGSYVPHLSVADDLQPVGVEDPTEGLVELVKLVNLGGSPVVPEHPVTEDQLIARVKSGSVS